MLVKCGSYSVLAIKQCQTRLNLLFFYIVLNKASNRLFNQFTSSLQLVSFCFWIAPLTIMFCVLIARHPSKPAFPGIAKA
ncbi:hypothetical protein FKM82_011192 [Ascaphus truei]